MRLAAPWCVSGCARAHRAVGGQDARSRGHGAWKGGEGMHLPVFCQHEKSGEFLLALAHPGTFATRGRWLRCVDRRSFLFVLLICLAELIELDEFTLRTY